MVLNDLSAKLTKTVQSMMRRNNLNSDYINKILDEIIQTLQQADIEAEILQKMKQDILSEIKHISSENNNINLHNYLLQSVHQHLVNLFATTTVKPFTPQQSQTSIIAFYGLQGQGKTTSIVKFGQYYKRKGFRVGVICCDTFRAGAYDQLKQNALSAKLAFYGEKDCKNSVQIAQNGIEFFKKNKINLILIDTSGRHKQSEELIQEMKQLDSAVHPHHSIFVIDASTGKGVKMQAEAFKNAVNLHSIILTKVDGSVTSGGALSAVATLKVPVCFIGTGERLQDFERFNPNSFVNKLMGLGDMESLAEAAINNNVDSQQQAKNLSEMLQGRFTFLNFQQQITEMLKLGNMEDIMAKVPNMEQIAKEYGFDSEKEGTPALKRWLNMFNSMKQKELQMSPSQFQHLPNYNQICTRIARGSGYSITKVTEMVHYAIQMQEQGNKLGSNKFGQAMQQLMQLQSAMKNGSIPPQQMQQAQQMMEQLQRMCQIPGLKPGEDPQKALQIMRQMGFLPETAQMKQAAKHLKKGGRYK